MKPLSLSGELVTQGYLGDLSKKREGISGTSGRLCPVNCNELLLRI